MTRNTNFSKKVYQIVKKIPKGKVTTYREIALRCQKSKVKSQRSNIIARAVGNALHRNSNKRVFCHRVVDRSGRLASKFAFGGSKIQRKKLIAEGVRMVDNNHVDLGKSLWQK
ncbi:hypothetical protein A2164_00615 [Candidatus Curtissbacteria bacterium RBG_13_35_7]|uniref:Methylated-DNA-[protein]-cysteine S-methyltransferase DNA binding domain-containing protein n=1 Tax=Candidatus Curtissbacteria bacterium RBG_13_35_7 TaxID=1797705 RepID=A0A1F5G343_9BACT|nr:MAG: hypothetical protein A2164_00615 [Candidatus Curtissbacteria bacterium RBG_13_35_7]